MAENDQAEKTPAEGDAPPASKKKKLILIAAAVAVLCLAGGAGAWFFFHNHGDEQHAEAPPPKPPAFVEVPDMLVNLVGAPGERVQYHTVKVVLEDKDEPQVEKIKPALPRVTDHLQTYMRELRPSDLNGSAGLFRLKEELTKRVNTAISPGHVNAVLFKEVVIQ
jgi:flagellar FliL protein